MDKLVELTGRPRGRRCRCDLDQTPKAGIASWTITLPFDNDGGDYDGSGEWLV